MISRRNYEYPNRIPSKLRTKIHTETFDLEICLNQQLNNALFWLIYVTALISIFTRLVYIQVQHIVADSRVEYREMCSRLVSLRHGFDFRLFHIYMQQNSSCWVSYVRTYWQSYCAVRRCTWSFDASQFLQTSQFTSHCSLILLKLTCSGYWRTAFVSAKLLTFKIFLEI